MEHMSAQPEAWVAFLLSACPENVVPKVWPDASTAEESIRRLLLLKCFRPDRMLAAIVTYVQHRHMAESSYNFDSAPPMKPAQSENDELKLVKVRGFGPVPESGPARADAGRTSLTPE
ncbi:hypothetical protein PCANC_10438 [Puccinia coronata f. sp. avenae]|uniref:Uncharacterized protein n=1 Tax=Puccinia coronata f. sp. avenae TaxID=200324 RepID=A0A2N5VI99_9BASI|nr:hypothetical protein PCASD_12955 [Puccinia coronata f. sp. avenae]PLW49719.1 hypothetical protein PCANC_10438 [Puccinia coronata f. sp. avenae]